MRGIETGMRQKSYSKYQLNILKEYYPNGEWDRIMPIFPNKTKADIRAIARKNGIKRTRIKDVDISGQRYGKLTALYRDDTARPVRWICRCDCGKEIAVSVYSLKGGITKSCGCLKHEPASNAKDYSGKVFGLLTAVERLPQYKRGETHYRCICQCGKTKIVSSGNLVQGHVRTCGGKNHSKKQFEILNRDLNDTERAYYVYRHISPNGKSYIGITKQNPDRRFQNGMGYATQKPFYHAIKKYGWESFTHEILEEGLTEKEACEKEAYYISNVYDSITPHGYNSREGGISVRNKVTPIVQYYNGKPVNFFESITLASRELGVAQKTIKIHCGAQNSIGGYYFEHLEPIAPYNIDIELRSIRDESHYVFKDIIKQDIKKQVLERNKKCGKPINKYSLSGEYICTYKSIAEAKRSIQSTDGEAICAAVNPNRQGETAYGFMWRYDEGNHSNIDPVRYKAQKAVIMVDKSDERIISEYESITKASKALGVSIYKIKQECLGIKTLFEGYSLKYR